jgi:hypothetical protein
VDRVERGTISKMALAQAQRMEGKYSKGYWMDEIASDGGMKRTYEMNDTRSRKFLEMRRLKNS